MDHRAPSWSDGSGELANSQDLEERWTYVDEEFKRLSADEFSPSATSPARECGDSIHHPSRTSMFCMSSSYQGQHSIQKEECVGVGLSSSGMAAGWTTAALASGRGSSGRRNSGDGQLRRLVQPLLLVHETVMWEEPDAILVNTHTRGCLLITSLRLLFLTPEPNCQPASANGSLTLSVLPLGSCFLSVIDRVSKPASLRSPSFFASQERVQIHSRDARVLVFSVPCCAPPQRPSLFDAVVHMLPRSLRELPAFHLHAQTLALVAAAAAALVSPPFSGSSSSLCAPASACPPLACPSGPHPLHTAASFPPLLHPSDAAASLAASAGSCHLPRDPLDVLSCEYRRLLALQPQHGGQRDGPPRPPQWRVSSVNLHYRLCPSYPQLLLLPASISDEDAAASAAFRARGRLPVLCWQHPLNGAALSRAAQPLVGILTNNRSDADERLLAALAGQGAGGAGGQQGGAGSGSSSGGGSVSRRLVVADARPRKNAIANGAMGGGCESAAHYRGAEVVYLGIENVHALRDSLVRLREFLDAHGAACSDGSSSLLHSGAPGWAGGAVSRASQVAAALQDSAWLQHLHSLLSGAVFVAAQIAHGASVLVHCSDGWDRTPSLVSLALLLLDPFYRTFAGFQVLVEVHWAAFGHQFADRLGLPSACSSSSSAPLSSPLSSSNLPGAPPSSPLPQDAPPALPLSAASLPAPAAPFHAGHPSSQSPVFLQWVDAVAQLVRLFPRAFEFSTAFLVDLLDAVLAARCLNFVANSEKERRRLGVYRHGAGRGSSHEGSAAGQAAFGGSEAAAGRDNMGQAGTGARPRGREGQAAGGLDAAAGSFGSGCVWEHLRRLREGSAGPCLAGEARGRGTGVREGAAAAPAADSKSGAGVAGEGRQGGSVGASVQPECCQRTHEHFNPLYCANMPAIDFGARESANAAESPLTASPSAPNDSQPGRTGINGSAARVPSAAPGFPCGTALSPLLPPAASLAPVLLPELYLRWCCPSATLLHPPGAGEEPQEAGRGPAAGGSDSSTAPAAPPPAALSAPVPGLGLPRGEPLHRDSVLMEIRRLQHDLTRAHAEARRSAASEAAAVQEAERLRTAARSMQAEQARTSQRMAEEVARQQQQLRACLEDNARLRERCLRAEQSLQLHLEAMEAAEAAIEGERRRGGSACNEPNGAAAGHSSARGEGAGMLRVSSSLSLPREAEGAGRPQQAVASSWSPSVGHAEAAEEAQKEGAPRMEQEGQAWWPQAGKEGRQARPPASGCLKQGSAPSSACSNEAKLPHQWRGKEVIGVKADFESLRCARISDYIGGQVAPQGRGSETTSAV